MSTHPDAILAELRASPLFAEDFPKRSHLSLADWNQLPEDEQDRPDQAGVDAMARVRALYAPWEAGVHALGESRHLPAIFPTPGGKGAIVPVDDVLSALDDEREQYE